MIEIGIYEILISGRFEISAAVVDVVVVIQNDAIVRVNILLCPISPFDSFAEVLGN